MNILNTRLLYATLMTGSITLFSTTSQAHGNHHRIVVVKPAPTKVVVINRPRNRSCHGYWHRGVWHCHRHQPGRVLTHAIADALWWESRH
jgi:hypothetical protein